MRGQARFNVLGSVEIVVGDAPVPLERPQRRAVLAYVVLNAGRTVSSAELMEALWGEALPATAQAQVYALVCAVRQALRTAGADCLVSVPGGYRLEAAADETDLGVFEAKMKQAFELASDPRRAGRILRDALKLWRGEPLSGISASFAEPVRVQLRESRITAYEQLVELHLTAGLHREVIAELTALVAENPLRERLVAQLMLAMHRSERPAEALAVYRRCRDLLAAEHGMDPGPVLRDLERRILREETTIDLPSTVPPGVLAASARRFRPGEVRKFNSLPRDIGHFTGRTAQLELLLSIADSSFPTVVHAIDGMAGVGKTALAVHAAHKLASRFADGQLFVDLHGYTTGREPLTSDEALAVLLRAVGVADSLIPKNQDEKAARWRAELAGQRVLVVLDNAVSSAQVRPLLPGSAGCAVLVTSRRNLVGLDAAATLSLEPMPVPDAVALFRMITGPDRVDAEREAANEVVRLCGYLPLAVGIAAERLRTRPLWTVGRLAERLGEDHGRSALLRTDEHGVASAFTVSYQDLAAGEQRMFRLLGLCPGSDIDVYVAAALADVPVDLAENLLDALCDVNLLIRHSADRYRLHDLVRDFAHASAESDETALARTTACDRLLDYYLQVCELAAELNTPGRRKLGPGPRYRPAALPELSRPSDVWSWAWAEHGNLLPIARLAAQTGTGGHSWQVPRSIGTLLYKAGQHVAGLEAMTLGLEACSYDTDPAIRSVCLLDVSLMYRALGEYRHALDYLTEGTAIATKLGDREGMARSLSHLAELSYYIGSFADAITYALRSIELYREEGDRWHEATVLTILMDALCGLGRHREAIDAVKRAEVAVEGLADRRIAGHVMSRLGPAHSHLNEHDVALSLLRECVNIFREAKERRFEADYLHRLADALRRSGQPHEALKCAQEALVILHDVTDPIDLADTHNALGAAYSDLGKYHEALSHYRQTLAVTANVEYRIAQAHALGGTGRCLAMLNDPEGAAEHEGQAQTIYRDLGVPDAAHEGLLESEPPAV